MKPSAIIFGITCGAACVPASAATLLIDASAATTVTTSVTGVRDAQYDITTQFNTASSSYTSDKATVDQINFSWNAANPVAVTTRRIYFVRGATTLGALQYFAQTVGGFGPSGTPWVTTFAAFYWDALNSSGLPGPTIGQVSTVQLTGSEYELPEFGASSSLNAKIRFASPPLTGQVPEPASWALMILGFGLVGGALRRRARTGTAVRAA